MRPMCFQTVTVPVLHVVFFTSAMHVFKSHCQHHTSGLSHVPSTAVTSTLRPPGAPVPRPKPSSSSSYFSSPNVANYRHEPRHVQGRGDAQTDTHGSLHQKMPRGSRVERARKARRCARKRAPAARAHGSQVTVLNKQNKSKKSHRTRFETTLYLPPSPASVP